ncbi:hypothetical protein GGI43DRAFT_429061 [Trichoderma evansii]
MSWRRHAGILVRQNGDSLVPALCVEACNEAATAGQQSSQSSLCTSKNFLFFVDQCIRCIDEVIDTSPFGATPIPSLLPYLQEYHMVGYTVKAVPGTDSKTSTVTFLLPTDTAYTFTSTAQSSSSAVSSTSSGSQSVTSSPPSSTSSSSRGSITSGSQTSTSPSSQSITSSQGHRQTSGAVIGPITGLAITFGALFFFLKRHKRVKQVEYDSADGKAQLESDINGIYELDSAPIRGEMPANEAPANEIPANEAPANEAPANEAPAVELQARKDM